MTLVSPSELAALRVVAESSFPTDVTIYRYTRATTAEGSVQSWTQRTTVKGWLKEETTPPVGEVGGVQATVPVYRLNVPVGTDIEAGDRVRIEGATYEVNDVNTEDSYLTHVTARLRRRE